MRSLMLYGRVRQSCVAPYNVVSQQDRLLLKPSALRFVRVAPVCCLLCLLWPGPLQRPPACSSAPVEFVTLHAPPLPRQYQR